MWEWESILNLGSGIREEDQLAAFKSFLSPHKIISDTSQANWSSAKNFYSRIESIYPPLPRLKLL